MDSDFSIKSDAALSPIVQRNTYYCVHASKAVSPQSDICPNWSYKKDAAHFAPLHTSLMEARKH